MDTRIVVLALACIGSVVYNIYTLFRVHHNPELTTKQKLVEESDEWANLSFRFCTILAGCFVFIPTLIENGIAPLGFIIVMVICLYAKYTTDRTLRSP
jgi:hypothetical protein